MRGGLGHIGALKEICVLVLCAEAISVDVMMYFLDRQPTHVGGFRFLFFNRFDMSLRPVVEHLLEPLMAGLESGV